MNTRHYVFRRTNLPCLRCDDVVRQLNQKVYERDDGDDKTRIIYFCPTCQGTSVEVKPPKRRATPVDAVAGTLARADRGGARGTRGARGKRREDA